MQRMTEEPSSLRLARRCGARTRSGTPCCSPATKGKARCRMHGGAAGHGAPRNERNGNYRHGRYTCEAIAERRRFRDLLRMVRTLDLA
ncbi:HGGxSTG domain-containing protein [uncultured Enterovirga sp.]|uniref:HGGxSTG domain-containing protein n=1 Tax=uncultured Enterovirga sp. TaxID=2026352 RepID=UPI0035CC9406